MIVMCVRGDMRRDYSMIERPCVAPFASALMWAEVPGRPLVSIPHVRPRQSHSCCPFACARDAPLHFSLSLPPTYLLLDISLVGRKDVPGSHLPILSALMSHVVTAHSQHTLSQ